MSAAFDPDAFERALAGATEARSSARVTSTRWAWRQAAAVRRDFLEFSTLRTPAEDSNAELSLEDDCRLVPDANGEPRWRLDDRLRRRALLRLETPERILELIALNRAPGDSYQRHLEAMARGKPIELGGLTFSELVEVHQLAEWLKGLKLPGVPDLRTVEQQLELADLLAPFRALTAHGFYGRAEVLERMERYVHGDRSTSGGRLWRWLRISRRRRETRPIMLQGIGGSGKSTVIAQFLLDLRAQPDPLLFAYVDFDRPGLRAREPLTLLAEIARQVGIQEPALAAATAFVRRAALERVAAHGDDRAVVAQADRLALLARFGRAVAGAIDPERPLVLVLDTLEEVQYRGQEFVTQLWSFLDELHDAISGLRVIAAGRIPLPPDAAEPLEVKDLDPSSAEAFVRERLELADIDTRPIAKSIIEQVGCNPLSLTLAAEVVRDIGTEGLKEALREGGAERDIDTELVQGVLYHRILQHVHDEEIEKFALPGLALRRITPAVIREVLAEPCGVDVPDDETAEELLERFAAEVALVEADPDGFVRYRSDVRRLALRLIPKDPKLPIATIDSRAVEFYTGQEGAGARAEELYHRLRRKDPREELERLWDPALGDLVADALDDLQGREYVWLATKLGRPLAPDSLAQADQPEWEAHAALSARNQLDLGDPKAALEVLRERKDRDPSSRLPLLEAEACVRLGRLKDAAKALEAGLRAASATDEANLVVELNLASARVLRRQQELQPAVQRLQAAVEAAAALDDPFVELDILLTADELELPSAVAGIQADHVLDRAGLSELAKRPEVLAKTVGAFGEHRPALLLEALRTLGLPTRGARDIALLADALQVLTGEPAGTWDAALRDAAANPGLAHDLFVGRLGAPVAGRLANLFARLAAPAGGRPQPAARSVAPPSARAHTNAERRLSTALWAAAVAGLGLAACALVFGLIDSGSEPLAALSTAFGILLAMLAWLAAGDVRRYGWIALVLAFGYGCASVTLSLWATPAALGGAIGAVALVVLWSAASRARHGLRFLGPVAFHTVIALAEVLTSDRDEAVSAEQVARNVDGYLADAGGRADRDARNIEQRVAGRKGPAPVLLRNALTTLGVAPLMSLRPPLTAMAPSARKRYLERLLVGDAGRAPRPLKTAMQTLLRAGCQLVYLGYYGDRRSWPAIGYTPFSLRPGGQLSKPEDVGEPPLRSSAGPPPADTRYDTVVIGSGAGGAIAAYRLAETGRRVLVVERGPHVDPREFVEEEAAQYLKLYDEGGLRKVVSTSLQVLSGACVGGSTTIGNAVCLLPPHAVIEGWAEHGVDAPMLHRAIEEVRTWLSIEPAAPARTSGGAARFVDGIRQLALPGRLELTESSLRDCLGCGYCNLGCGFGRKLSMLDTVLVWAQQRFGLEVLPAFEVRRIEHAGDRAVAVSGDRFGEALTVRADEVVIAAGAVASSSLLRRSKIGGKRPGAELYFGLGTPMVAEFPDEVHSYAGLQTSHTYVPEYEVAPPFLLETFFHQPLAQALDMPGWFDQHRANMRRYAYMAGGTVLTSATAPARLGMRLKRGPILEWITSAEDRARLLDGLSLLGRIFLAAGAMRVMPASHSYHEYSSPAALRSMYDHLSGAREPLLTTGTPQGGNAMGAPGEGGVVDDDFRVHGFKNLYVCDASVFPTAVGVPPLLTVMGMAQYAAQRITAA